MMTTSETKTQLKRKSTCITTLIICMSVFVILAVNGCTTKQPAITEIKKPVDEYTMTLKYEFETNNGSSFLPIEYRLTPKGNDDLYKAVFLLSLIESSNNVVHPNSVEFVKRYAPFFDPDGNMKISDKEANSFLKRIQIEYSHKGIKSDPVELREQTLSSYVVRTEN